MFGFQRFFTPESPSSPLLAPAFIAEELSSFSEILSSALSPSSYPSSWEASSLDSPLCPLGSLSSLGADFKNFLPSLSDSERQSPTSPLSSDYFSSPSSTSTSWSPSSDSWPSSTSELDELEWTPPNTLPIRSIDEQCQTVRPVDVMPREDSLYPNALALNPTFDVDSGYASNSASEYHTPKAASGLRRKQAKAKRKVSSMKVEEADLVCIDQDNQGSSSAPKLFGPSASLKCKRKSEGISLPTVRAPIEGDCGEGSSKMITEGSPASPKVACPSPSCKRKRELEGANLPTATATAPIEEDCVERPSKMIKYQASPTPPPEEVNTTRKPRRGRPNRCFTHPYPSITSPGILDGTRKYITTEELDNLVSSSRVGGETGCQVEDPSSWQSPIPTRRKATKFVCRLCYGPDLPNFSTQHRMKSHYTGKMNHGLMSPLTLLCEKCLKYQTANSSDLSRHQKSIKCKRASLALMHMSEE